MHRADWSGWLRNAALAAACAVFAQGCSLLLVRPPPSYESSDPPRCTTNLVPALGDLLLAGGAAFLAHYAWDATQACSPNCVESAAPELFVVIAAAAAGAVGSAYYGFRHTSRCRDAEKSSCAAHDCRTAPLGAVTGSPSPGR
jgi:hypothetical protein